MSIFDYAHQTAERTSIWRCAEARSDEERPDGRSWRRHSAVSTVLRTGSPFHGRHFTVRACGSRYTYFPWPRQCDRRGATEMLVWTLIVRWKYARTSAQFLLVCRSDEDLKFSNLDPIVMVYTNAFLNIINYLS